MALNITDSDFEKEVLKSDIPVLVDFWAPWCGPCRMMAPIIDEISEKYKGKIKVAKLNTDENPVSATEYQITAIPTLMIFKNGKVIKEMVGVVPKNEIERIIEEEVI